MPQVWASKAPDWTSSRSVNWGPPPLPRVFTEQGGAKGMMVEMGPFPCLPGPSGSGPSYPGWLSGSRAWTEAFGQFSRGLLGEGDGRDSAQGCFFLEQKGDQRDTRGCFGLSPPPHPPRRGSRGRDDPVSNRLVGDHSFSNERCSLMCFYKFFHQLFRDSCCSANG